MRTLFTVLLLSLRIYSSIFHAFFFFQADTTLVMLHLLLLVVTVAMVVMVAMVFQKLSHQLVLMQLQLHMADILMVCLLCHDKIR